MNKSPSVPLQIEKGAKRELRTQFGALCYRANKGKTEVLLITSRTRKRWIIPKGWPADGLTPAQAAAQEAWEEAGVTGKASDTCVGLFSYTKQLDENNLPCMVAVFPVRVKKQVDEFPEKGERQRRWVSVPKAVKLISDPEMRAILMRFEGLISK